MTSFADIEIKKTQRIDHTKKNKNTDNDQLHQRISQNFTFFACLVNWNFTVWNYIANIHTKFIATRISIFTIIISLV